MNERSVPSYLVEFARRLRDARLEHNISPDELALAAGLADGPSVLRIERCASGRGELSHGPRFETIVKLALALGLSPSELMP